MESMVWLNDFSNSGSLAYQQLSAKFQKAVGRKILIEVFLQMTKAAVRRGRGEQIWVAF